jgi:hypothetical protein
MFHAPIPPVWVGIRVEALVQPKLATHVYPSEAFSPESVRLLADAAASYSRWTRDTLSADPGELYDSPFELAIFAIEPAAGFYYANRLYLAKFDYTWAELKAIRGNSKFSLQPDYDESLKKVRECGVKTGYTALYFDRTGRHMLMGPAIYWRIDTLKNCPHAIGAIFTSTSV